MSTSIGERVLGAFPAWKHERLGLEDRRLGWLLGLGDLEGREICHGYPTGCRCTDCLARADAPQAPETAAQPWDVGRAA